MCPFLNQLTTWPLNNDTKSCHSRRWPQQVWASSKPCASALSLELLQSSAAHCFSLPPAQHVKLTSSACVLKLGVFYGPCAPDPQGSRSRGGLGTATRALRAATLKGLLLRPGGLSTERRRGLLAGPGGACQQGQDCQRRGGSQRGPKRGQEDFYGGPRRIVSGPQEDCQWASGGLSVGPWRIVSRAPRRIVSGPREDCQWGQGGLSAAPPKLTGRTVRPPPDSCQKASRS